MKQDESHPAWTPTVTSFSEWTPQVIKGDVNAVREYKEMMFQYHPNFKISNCFTLLKGVDPEQFKTIESLLNKAFDESNTKK